MVTPVINIINHWKRLGTIRVLAGKNIGMQIEARKMNWWAIAYVEDYFRVNRCELTMPYRMPGMN